MSFLYQVVGSAPAFGGACEAWVELQLLGRSGVYSDPLVALNSASDAVRTSNPGDIPANVAVVFGPASSNEGLGHSGISLGGGQMKSVWSDGSVVIESIAQFARDNGAPLLGYHDFGKGIPGTAAAFTISGSRTADVVAALQSLPLPVKVLGGMAAALWFLD